MAVKRNDNFLLLALLAAGGYWWYTEEQKKKALPQTAQGPFSNGNTVSYSAPGSAGTFTNYAGITDNVNTAKAQFQTLIDAGLINDNAGSLGLSPYEKDVVYKDFHASALLTTDAAKIVSAEADKVYAKYPGLKV